MQVKQRILLQSLVAAFLTVIGGCSLLGESETGDDLTFTVEASMVRPADTVTLILANGRSRTVWYNLSCSDLQRQAHSQWRPVETGRGCYAYVKELHPGEMASFDVELPENLPEDTYRFTTHAGENLTSNTFVVKGKEQ